MQLVRRQQAVEEGECDLRASGAVSVCVLLLHHLLEWGLDTELPYSASNKGDAKGQEVVTRRDDQTGAGGSVSTVLPKILPRLLAPGSKCQGPSLRRAARASCNPSLREWCAWVLS